MIDSKQGAYDSGVESEEDIKTDEQNNNRIKQAQEVEQDNDSSEEDSPGEEEDMDEQNPDMQIRLWKSNLIKSGLGSFLQPN